MNKRKLVVGIVFLLFAVIALATTAYAFWASKQNLTTDENTLTIGEDSSTLTTTTASLTVDDALVPIGQGTPNTSEFTFNLLWANDGVGNNQEGILSVEFTPSSLEIGTYSAQTELTNMFTVSIQGDNTITRNSVAKDFIVIIEFTNEPSTEAIYDQIKNGTLKFKLDFTVTPNA